MAVSLEELKSKINPVELAERLLGKPEKFISGKAWYKSPFRAEKEPSFIATTRGYHDFGDGWSGDAIDLMMRLYNLTFSQAIQLLSRTYGLEANEYETEKIIEIKKQQSLQRKERAIEVTRWYNDSYGKLCDAWKLWTDLKNNQEPLSDGYVYCLKELDKIEYWIEVFLEFIDRKEVLWNERDNIWYLKNFITS